MSYRVDVGRSLTVIAEGGPIALELADDAGVEWLVSGPGGDALGPLNEVLVASAAAGFDPRWIDAVVSAVGRELAGKVRRSRLLVKRGQGAWYHVTFTANRASIREHGLDWQYMTGFGIAGSIAPEYPGIFLCAGLPDADFFVRIGARRGAVDIWEVELDGQWLEGAPDCDGGGGENWMISPQPIGADKLRLVDDGLRSK